MFGVIRDFQDEDLGSLVDIWKMASKDLYRGRSNDDWNLLEKYTQDFVRWGVTFVYESAGKPIGFVTLMDGDLVLIAISPSCQEKGAAADLIKFAQSKFDRIKLRVHAANERAIRLYKRAGFRLVGQPLPDSFGALQRIMWWHRPIRE